MTITFNWLVTKATVSPSLGGFSDVVTQVDWVCQGTDAANNLTASCPGTTVLSSPEQNFVAYKNLTQDEMLAWCFAPMTVTNSLGTVAIDTKTAAQNQVTTQLEMLLAEKTNSIALPWAA